jgi:flagellar biogenesis protein FliO
VTVALKVTAVLVCAGLGATVSAVVVAVGTNSLMVSVTAEEVELLNPALPE